MTLDIEVEDLWLRYGAPSWRSRRGVTVPRAEPRPEPDYGYGSLHRRGWGFPGLRRRPVCSDPDALRGLSLTLKGGKIYGLLGRNGAGKTTLLSVLAAYRQATAGRVRVGGEPVYENPAVAGQVCLVGTGDAVLARGTVGQAVAVVACLRPDFDVAYADGLLERFRLRCDTSVDSLSHGGKAVLRIVLGLASRAGVTLFDEPHLGLDPPTRRRFYDELLADFSAHPRTIIVSTHLVEEISGLFEEVVIIDRGRLVVHDTAEDLRARGASVTGPAEAVDRFVHGRTVLGAKRLGPTKSVMVDGHIDRSDREQARADGLDLGPVALQDLFVHLTQERS
ncbi:MAG: ATP-binding cassette domain-containing protein [Solirubrobacterales bacterium]